VAYPNVSTSNVRVRSIANTYRLVNSEGTVVRVPEEAADISIIATALADDGSRVWNHDFVSVLRSAQFPSEEQLRKAADAVAQETDQLRKAPVAEDYSGPVLFEQEAAAEMMAEVLTDAIRLQRKPVAPPGSDQSGTILESVWASRVGSKVVPDWLTIYDDPRQEQFHGTPLAGHYQVDDEGVPGESTTLVENGVLKGFLLSREPVRTFNGSNGHGRLPGGFGSQAAVIGNLFVEPKQTVPEAQMKPKLLEKVKSAGLKYGILIRRMDFPSTANYTELQTFARELQKNGYSRSLNPVLLAYRVYPDGREELIRALRFKDFSARDLRDIDLASDKPFVLNYFNNGSSLNLADWGSDATTSSVICPSLLFDSVDLGHAEEEAGRLPIVPSPDLIPQH
jgi:hypothetical protein